MAIKIRIDSFNESNIQERSSLSAAVDAADTALVLQSTQGFSASDILYLGHPGREKCEKLVITTVDDATTLTTSAVKHDHAAFAPVMSVVGDRIRIYRAPNVDGSRPAENTYSVLGTREIDPDQPSTYYTDSTGSSEYWYRTSYFNETSQAETALSEPFRGDDTVHYASLRAIRREAGFEKATNLKDSIVEEQRRQAESEINAALAGIYSVPFNPVPEVVRTLTVQLATAHLLIVAYGNSAQYAARLKAARDDLKAYADNEAAILDETGGSQRPDSFDSYFGDEQRVFEMGDLY